MFGLTTLLSSGALTTATALGLPLAVQAGGGIHRHEENAMTLHALMPPASSTSFSAWLLNGHWGDFLDWTGKPLADKGQALSSSFDLFERQETMYQAKRALNELFAEALMGENVDNQLPPILATYLRQGIALTNAKALLPTVWIAELRELAWQAERVGEVTTVQVLSAWSEQLTLLSEKDDSLASHREDSEDFTNRNSEERATVSEFIDKDASPTVYPTPFELSSLNGTNGFQINGVDLNGWVGWSVSGVGDVNGDGYADVIIGAPNASPGGRANAGQSYVIFGQASFDKTLALSNLNGTNGFQINGVATLDNSGFSTSGAGDVNGDGYADIIIGAVYASPYGYYHAGQSYVIFGKTNFEDSFELSSLNGSNGFQINGITADDVSGYSVSGAGDVNHDGYDDLIIGARYASPDGRAKAGECYVVFGKASFETPLALSTLDGNNGFQINGVTAGDTLGFSVSGAGDINRDDYDDLIISSSGVSYYVVFGKTSFESPLELSSLDGNNGFQISNDVNALSNAVVSRAGDVNGDGYVDVIIGAEYGSPGGRNKAGESYVIFGKASFENPFRLSSLDGSNGFQMNGIAVMDWSGCSVSGGNDFNNDGYDDVIIGAHNAAPNGLNAAGESYVIFGKSKFDTPLELSNLDGNNGFQINGISTNPQYTGDNSGTSVSAGGDINNDGYDDVIIGAFQADWGAGQSYVIFGVGISPSPSPSPSLSLSPSPTLTPKPTPSPSPTSDGLSTKVLVGLIAGGLGLFAMGACVTTYCCRKKNQEEKEPLLTEVGESEYDYPRNVYATQGKRNIQQDA